MEKLPAEIIAKIMLMAVLSTDEPDDYCPLCHRPYYFLLTDPTALAIQATCARWKAIFVYRCLHQGITKPNVPWCVTPQKCVKKLATHLASRAAKSAADGLFTVPHMVADLIEGRSQDEDNGVSDEVESDNSDD